MRRAFVVATLVACTPSETVSGDAAGEASPACLEATQHSDIAWIEQNVFVPSCVFGDCHSGNNQTKQSMIDLHVGQARAHLLGVQSMLDPTRTLVVASAPRQSWLIVMIGQIQPADADPPAGPLPAEIGTMPQGTAGELLCAEKRDAIERWIAAGAN